MIGMILLVFLTIGLGVTTAINYKAYEDTLAKYEKALDELEIQRIKNDALQKDNASMQDQIWHLSQNLMHREAEK